jgi:hypothetical protein
MRPGLQKHRSARLPVSLRALASSRAVLAAVPLAALLLASGCGGSSPTRGRHRPRVPRRPAAPR